MALVLIVPAPPLEAGTYMRIDGIRFEPVSRLRADGCWSVDPGTPVRFHVYAYRSAAARAAGDAPMSDMAHVGTMGDLALLDIVAGTAHLRLGPAWRAREMNTGTLWHSIYSGLARHYWGMTEYS